ncbi:MAG TPA: hypothetical protein VNZ47_05205 [Candidatus Dormibacteraeota bacterium]|jgi:hypothetical protein|nr:hypothetical protein [Candidatus Dormibacteraeota bacterium]
MKSNFPTESMIREYLLGRLNGQDKLESSLSEQMLFDNELSEIVDSIEDELIEDYLDGLLSVADRKAIEEYFLSPPERKEKLRFARYLRNHLETKPAVVEKKILDAPPEPILKRTEARGSGRSLVLHLRTHLRTCFEIAAVLLLSLAGFTYVSHVRDLQSQLEAARKTDAQLSNELTQARDHAANLAKQLREARPPVAVLSFLGSLFRENPGTKEVEISPWTERIKVSIDLQNASTRDYDVRLENQARQTLWTQAHMPGSSNGLVFEMPAQSIPTTGAYCLVVRSRPEPYCFRAKVMKN